MTELLRTITWPEWRHHPWRTVAAVVAVMLGVALAWSVHVINASALGEFDAAVRAVNGTPDFELRAPAGGFDEMLYARVATNPQVALASPVVEVETAALDAAGARVPLRVLGVDALVAGALAPGVLPHPRRGEERMAFVDPDTVFLNAQAALRLDPSGTATSVKLQTPHGVSAVRIAGTVAAPGPALAVMDIAGVQARFERLGRLSRIDVRLAPGADRAAVLRALALPAGVRAAAPDEGTQRLANVSRAYRVNLSVLALVALFTGAFLVWSVLALSVAQRQPQVALLGVLGLGARERLGLVLVESARRGGLGSALGLALGTGLAALALRVLGGDLGGGYFAGVAPALHLEPAAAAAYGILGIGAAVIGGWQPARAAARLAPAQALKGLGSGVGRHAPAALGPLLLVGGALLALAPPVLDLPLAAYAAIACLLFGGIACVPMLIAAALRLWPAQRSALALVAVERVRRERHAATVAVAGVVASLSLSVALTVMGGSFRTSMVRWLDAVLPADLYVRAGIAGSEGAVLPDAFVGRAAQVPGVARIETLRVVAVQLDPARPAVALLSRALGADPAARLPLTGPLLPLPEGETAAYVSEAMVDLYGAKPGTRIDVPLPDGRRAALFVRGVWRDYARQHGAVAIESSDYRRLTGDTRSSDLALWLAPGTTVNDVQSRLRAAADAAGTDGALLEFAAPAAIRAASLRIFDRSFAVTYWLQAVAIAIGLFGIGASLSAQVLARRKEFGLLAHLGFTRAQVLGVVAAECALATGAGALLGLVLGLAVSVVLVDVVNPQSFHWTMDLAVPWPRLVALCAAVVAAGTVTGWLAARGAATRQAVLAVKEDW